MRVFVFGCHCFSFFQLFDFELFLSLACNHTVTRHRVQEAARLLMSFFLNFNNNIWKPPTPKIQDKVKANSQYYHLILAGTTDPPGYNAQCEEREDSSDCKENGNYLKQVIKNMQIVEHSIKWGEHDDGYKYRLYNSYKNNKAKRSDALQQIVGLFEEAKAKKCSGWNRVKIYYTG